MKRHPQGLFVFSLATILGVFSGFSHACCVGAFFFLNNIPIYQHQTAEDRNVVIGDMLPNSGEWNMALGQEDSTNNFVECCVQSFCVLTARVHRN